MLIASLCLASEALPGHVSRPGGAGHALLFQDHVVVKTDIKDFPTTALTFEAWISTSDFCHAGTVMSYAKDSKSPDDAQRITDFNHFVIFDTRGLLACHDFQYIDLVPDPANVSCHAAYANVSGSRQLPSLVERDGRWHHLAVTWTAADRGRTLIYVDGSLMATAYTQRTAPLEPGGAFMLGGEQDCFGGCVDPNQGFHGLMDEFDEPGDDPGIFGRHTVARDASGRGNDLTLESPPAPRSAAIPLPGFREPLRTGALEFRNGLAMNRRTRGFPTGSFTVEMWAKGAAVQDLDNLQQHATQLFSYAAQKGGSLDGASASGFLDDAVRIERLLASSIRTRRKYGRGNDWLDGTAGAVALHVNSNEHSDDPGREAVIIFDAQWTDDRWHHLAVTWDQRSGAASLFLDGIQRTPFYKSDYGAREERAPGEGGVGPSLAVGSSREGSGALVLGQDQDCLGGCFDASDAFAGQLAVVRLWDRPLAQSDIAAGLGRVQPPLRSGLVGLWSFGPEGLGTSEAGGPLALDSAGGPSPNHLQLRGSAPLYVYSTAPLAGSDGLPVPLPHPGAGGYSLALSDRQVLLLPSFRDFPSTALTLEFWMMSTDGCRPGVPFSYAVGEYQDGDNAFLLFNYNSWGVSVMEDEGRLGDHTSGVSATDGTWHHVAVTWDGTTGDVRLYDNGRPVWRVTRGRGRIIPSGGTLVIGREQDCKGGCFDSAEGAAGSISPVTNQEYGPQDFTGVIEEMRLWRVVRTPEQIAAGMEADDGRGPGDPLAEHPEPVPPADAGGSGSTHADTAGGGGGGGRRSHAGLIAMLVLGGVALAAVATTAAVHRRALSGMLPRSWGQLAYSLPLPASVRARLNPEYSPLVVNPEEMDMSPEFIAATPPRSGAPPGHAGSYYPLGAGSGVVPGSSPLSGGGGGGNAWLSAPPTPTPAGRGTTGGHGAV
ncbi:hypothetical protein GPECTOR_1g21 [Gonium pectorale]|uniref:Uncharacterized protein n=1 Tax=Gonium pectorale TaxID=33097 RepID=A0A150H2B0_GONPE|nr:hypothetical protein GPECTOR_1g21 [Gonium pectorale]|eukprot:KXZ56241.1 hypothetical protein GPECTOR_1g21 [Gonium pectorale]